MTEALSDKRILNETLDQLNDDRKKKRFDGSLIEFILSLDWERIFELIMRIVALFGSVSSIKSKVESQKAA